jgi:hypothetical protein
MENTHAFDAYVYFANSAAHFGILHAALDLRNVGGPHCNGIEMTVMNTSCDHVMTVMNTSCDRVTFFILFWLFTC